MKTPSDTHLRAWARMVRLTQQALACIDQRLARAGCISLTQYDVVYAVHSSPEGRLRLSDVACQVILSKSALSRTIDKLVDDALLERVRCPNDARASWLQVSAAGKRALKAAWPIYRAGIQEYFAERLSEKEANELAALLDQARARAGTRSD